MVPEVRDVQPAQDFIDGDDPDVMAHWALLIAGSAGWGNYRQVGVLLTAAVQLHYTSTTCADHLCLHFHFPLLHLLM